MGDYFDILVIDDEQVILDASSRICEDHQLTVDVVLDVDLAEKKLVKNEYGLILCDLMMTNKDGLQLLQYIIKNKIDIPVIIMTGYSTTENAVKALFNGAIDFITKPFTEDELIASVRRGLRTIQVIKNKSQPLCPENYFRLGISSWLAKQDDGTVIIGITRTYLETIENLVVIDLSQPGQQLVQGLTCAKLISGGLTHNYIAPVSGSVLDYNATLTDNIDLLKSDPYGEGWIYLVLPAAMEHEIKYLIPCKKVVS
jgi:DNA-binding response OmpR family regulator